MLKKYWAPIIGVVVILAGVASAIIILTSSSDASASVPTNVPINMIGTWIQTSGMPGTTMTATITEGQISIDVNMEGQNTSGLYWDGSFDSSARTSSEFVMTSIGDTKKMDSAMFASQDSSKIFTYKNGDLSFKYSILGMTSTIHLSRSSE